MQTDREKHKKRHKMPQRPPAQISDDMGKVMPRGSYNLANNAMVPRSSFSAGQSVHYYTSDEFMKTPSAPKRYEQTNMLDMPNKDVKEKTSKKRKGVMQMMLYKIVKPFTAKKPEKKAPVAQFADHNELVEKRIQAATLMSNKKTGFFWIFKRNKTPIALDLVLDSVTKRQVSLTQLGLPIDSPEYPRRSNLRYNEHLKEWLADDELGLAHDRSLTVDPDDGPMNPAEQVKVVPPNPQRVPRGQAGGRNSHSTLSSMKKSDTTPPQTPPRRNKSLEDEPKKSGTRIKKHRRKKGHRHHGSSNENNNPRTLENESELPDM